MEYFYVLNQFDFSVWFAIHIFFPLKPTILIVITYSDKYVNESDMELVIILDTNSVSLLKKDIKIYSRTIVGRKQAGYLDNIH